MALGRVGIELGEAGAALLGSGPVLGLEDLGELGLDPDRGELARVSADLVDADGRDHLLDPLGEGAAEVGDVGRIVVDADHLDHHVRTDAVGAEAEGEDDVVDVADRGRAQHDRAAPAQVVLTRIDAEALQGLVDRRDRQVRVEVAPLALVDGAVGQDEELGAVLDVLDGLLLQALDRALGRLGLQQRDVQGRSAVAEVLPEILEHVGLVLVGDLAVVLVGKGCELVVAAEQHRERGLGGAGVGGGIVQRRPAAEDRAGREMLHLALAVDRRVGHDRDRLLEVVGEVLALGRERRERPVVAERADRLGPVRGHLLHQLDVVALPAEPGQDPLADLDRLGWPGGGVARDLRTLERAACMEGAVVGSNLLRPGPLEPAVTHDPQDLGVRMAAGGPLGAIDRDHRLLARRQRLRLGDHLLDRDHPRFRAVDPVGRGLELPQRPQPERVGAEHALVAVPRDQGHGALRERPERLAQVHVEGVEVLGQGTDLVRDRRQNQLHRLSEGEPLPADQGLDHPVQVLGVGVALPDRDAEHPALLPQLLDRVDLAVVAEHPERLNAHERGPGVGRIAVVAEASDGLEALVGEVRVVAAEHLRRAHHLVDAGAPREGGDMDAELHLELDLELEQSAVEVRRLGNQPGDLPEVGLFLSCRGAECRRVGGTNSLGQDPETGPAEDLARIVPDLLDVM